MNRHIQEHTARYFYVRQSWRFRISGGDTNNMRSSNLSGCYRFLYCFKIVIKSAVKSYLIFHRMFLQRFLYLHDFFYTMIYRFLTEYMLVCLNCFYRNGGMGISGGTDQDRINLRIIQYFMIILRHLFHASTLCPCFFFFIHKWICQHLHFCIRNLCTDAFYMHFSDSSSPNNSYVH